jgi:hypothetical protein
MREGIIGEIWDTWRKNRHGKGRIAPKSVLSTVRFTGVPGLRFIHWLLAVIGERHNYLTGTKCGEACKCGISIDMLDYKEEDGFIKIYDKRKYKKNEKT